MSWVCHSVSLCAAPDLEGRQGVLDQVVETIKQHVTNSTTEQHAQDRVKHHVGQVIISPTEVIPLCSTTKDEPDETNTNEITDRIPVNADGTHADRDWVYVRVMPHSPVPRVKVSERKAHYPSSGASDKLAAPQTIPC